MPRTTLPATVFDLAVLIWRPAQRQKRRRPSPGWRAPAWPTTTPNPKRKLSRGRPERELESTGGSLLPSVARTSRAG
eukprot:8723274-Pyramimonas_sp.AAC.1